MGNCCSKKRDEYNTGIPMSKSGIEYDIGIPMSKSGIEIDPNTYNTGIPNSKSRRPMKPIKPMVYKTGIPMSKSRRPMNINSTKYNKDINEAIALITTAKPPIDTIIAIEDLLNKNGTVLSTLKACLEARGWCKIKYSDKTTQIIESVMENIQKWFTSTELEEKLKYSRKLNDGSNKPNPQSEYSYNRIDGFKEGLRILTGDVYKIHYKNDKYPDAVKDDILRINKEFDDLSVELMKVIANPVYGLNDYKQFGSKYDISILNDGKEAEQDINKKLKYSMLDFVNYYNDKEYIAKIRSNEINDKDGQLKPSVLKSEFNVFEHSDPGLFALSFASTNEGLEMYDELDGKWIKIGLNEGIWWNGKTANIIDNKIYPGKHRVKIDDKTFKPRFTGWYEVSCNRQLKKEIMSETLDMMTGDEVLNDEHVVISPHINEYNAGVPLSKFDPEFVNEPVVDVGDAKVEDNKDGFDGFTYTPVEKKNEYKKGIAVSKVIHIVQHDDGSDLKGTNLNEFEKGIPMSKDDDSDDLDEMNDEYNSGIPESKDADF